MAILTNINLILQLLFLCVLYTLWNIFHENEQDNERKFIIAMSVTELPLIGWSIIKMIFNDLISDGSIRSFLNFHKSKVLGIIWVPKRFNTKSTDFFTCSKKKHFIWHPRDLWPLEKLIVSRERERQVSPLWRGLCRKQDPLPTWDHSLPLSSQQSNLWKGCTGRLWIVRVF